MNAVIQAVDVRKKASQWFKTLMLVGLILSLMTLASDTHAGDGTELDTAATEWDGRMEGNLGKLAALIAIGVGSIVAAAKKDWSWFFDAMMLSVGIGVIAGIIDASFTAVIQTQEVTMSEKAGLSRYIPRQLNDGAKFLFWEIDVTMISLMGVLIGIGSDLPVIGLLLGIGAASFYGKLKARRYSGVATHLLYWFTGFPEPRGLPGGHIREPNGQGLHALQHQIK